LAIRNRLTQLTAWEIPGSIYAKAAATAIKLVLDRFVNKGSRFVWTLDLPRDGTISRYNVIIERSSNTENPWMCTDLPQTLESVLSLWLADIKERTRKAENNRNPAKRLYDQKSWLLLGPEEGTRLANNMRWWTGNQEKINSVKKPHHVSAAPNGGGMTLGIRGIQDLHTESGKETLSVNSNTTISLRRWSDP
jgi:hypothetical protein